ncbi:MAG: RHS repeat protein [Ruminococcaceae bacterium]|nr:RHS repeat protein [Oscillospiraceae bacterium]
MKKIISILLLVCFAIGCLTSCSNMKYEKALELIENGEYEEAYAIFEELGDYKDSKEQIKQLNYNQAIDFIEEGKYEEAYSIFKNLGNSDMCDKFYYVPVHIEYTSGNNKISHDFYYNENNILSQSLEFEDFETDSYNRNTVNDYEYDANGNLIKWIITNYKEEKSVYEYSYDTKGNLLNKTFTSGDGYRRTVEYTYDENGRLIKEYNVPGSTLEYAYDSNNNLIKKIYTYLPEGDQQINDYTYDKNGNLIKDIHTSYGINKHIIDYTYDANDNLIKKVFIHPDGMEYINEYIYDAKGNLIKEVYYESSRSNNRYVTDYTYDENNNLIKLIYKWNVTRIEEWTYDENGNITNYVNTANDKIVESTEYSYKLVYIPYDWEEISDATKDILAEKLGTRLENLG